MRLVIPINLGECVVIQFLVVLYILVLLQSLLAFVVALMRTDSMNIQ